MLCGQPGCGSIEILRSGVPIMSRQTLLGALPSTAATDGFPSLEQKNSSTPWLALSRLIQLWAARHHQRSGLRELAEQDDPLLRDMGIPRDKALIEAAKPFWKR
jgi:uncharacterized protein YjiS (DUF1127 family)